MTVQILPTGDPKGTRLPWLRRRMENLLRMLPGSSDRRAVRRTKRAERRKRHHDNLIRRDVAKFEKRSHR